MSQPGWESTEQLLEFSKMAAVETDEFLVAELAKAVGQVALITEAIETNKEKP